jgi:hypothetical protein
LPSLKSKPHSSRSRSQATPETSNPTIAVAATAQVFITTVSGVFL